MVPVEAGASSHWEAFCHTLVLSIKNHDNDTDDRDKAEVFFKAVREHLPAAELDLFTLMRHLRILYEVNQYDINHRVESITWALEPPLLRDVEEREIESDDEWPSLESSVAVNGNGTEDQTMDQVEEQNENQPPSQLNGHGEDQADNRVSRSGIVYNGRPFYWSESESDSN